MGSVFEAKCERCGYAWRASEGGGFLFVQLRCDTCGNVTARPRGAPSGSNAPMRTAEIRRLLSGGAQQWERAGRPFTPVELEVIERFFGRCGCGGKFLDENDSRARLRCVDCLSDKVSRGPDDAMFD